MGIYLRNKTLIEIVQTASAPDGYSQLHGMVVPFGWNITKSYQLACKCMYECVHVICGWSIFYKWFSNKNYTRKKDIYLIKFPKAWKIRPGVLLTFVSTENQWLSAILRWLRFSKLLYRIVFSAHPLSCKLSPSY